MKTGTQRVCTQLHPNSHLALVALGMHGYRYRYDYVWPKTTFKGESAVLSPLTVQGSEDAGSTSSLSQRAGYIMALHFNMPGP